MSIYAWNFEIKTFPEPPSGFNEAAPPPSPEVVATTETRVVDPQSPEFALWYSMLMTKVGVFRFAQYQTLIAQAIDAGALNIEGAPWPTLKKAAGAEPPVKSIKLFATAQWKQIYLLNNKGGGSGGHNVTYKEGVTTSDSETNSFGAKVGVSVTGGFGPVSATMSAEFSVDRKKTHSIAFTEEKTVTNTFNVPADTFTQVWQLSMFIQAGTDGPLIEQAMQIYQQLSYPHTAVSMSEEEAKVQAEAFLASLQAEALAN